MTLLVQRVTFSKIDVGVTKEIKRSLYEKVITSIPKNKRHELGDAKLQEMIFNIPADRLYGWNFYLESCKKPLRPNALDDLDKTGVRISEYAKQVTRILEENHFRVIGAYTAGKNYFDPKIVTVGLEHFRGHDEVAAMLRQLSSEVDVFTIENSEKDLEMVLRYNPPGRFQKGNFLIRESDQELNKKILNACNGKLLLPVDSDDVLREKTAIAWSRRDLEATNLYLLERCLLLMEPATLKLYNQGKRVAMLEGLNHTLKPYDLFQYYGVQRLVTIPRARFKLSIKIF